VYVHIGEQKDIAGVKKMKVLVSGSEGFVGGHLCNKLHELGHTVHGLDMVKQGKREVVVDKFLHKNLCAINEDDASWLDQYDVIYHLAILSPMTLLSEEY